MENLSQMVKESNVEEQIFSESDLELSDDSPATQENQANTQSSEQTETEETDESKIPVTSLTEWFPQNVENFPNLRQAMISIPDVNASEQLTMVVTKEVSGETKGKLVVFDESHQTPVINLPAVDMQIFSNTSFRIIYDVENSVFIKAYSVRKGLVCVFCVDVDNVLIPYHVERVKKNDTEISIAEAPNVDSVSAKLQEQLDIEALQLRYKQSSKATGLTTNLDAVKWLVERQGTIEDTNHHLQIDNAIISMITG